MTTRWSRERLEHLCETINECLEEGFPLDPGRGSFDGSAIRAAGKSKHKDSQ